ncbi:MAG: hypothetical protein ABR985_12745 [Methanotrichaceae archaeon]|jgi:hypothetical protein
MSDKPIPDSRMGGLFSKKKDSGVRSHESRVMKPEEEKHESRIMSQESGVMNKSQNQDTGVETHESRVKTHESGIMNQESLLMKHEFRIDSQALDLAVVQGCKDPRISAYSPLVMSVLRYLRKTTPEFSMSEVASSLLEDAIKERYPELSEQVKAALAKK